ncbi:MAG: calcium/sodium antiporter [Fibrobacter sp.]|nr:calcium/sodium antiporter [Fibrobacter sp.]
MIIESSFALIFGLLVLIWSADRFIDSTASVARHFGISPLLIGMVIVGFGTSAPEMVVSTFSSIQGNPGIAIGNAYGSNIANIALILGLTALICPISVQPRILFKELPALLFVTALAAFQLYDNELTRLDSIILLSLLILLLFLAFRQAKNAKDSNNTELFSKNPQTVQISLGKEILWLLCGLILLIASSRVLVWGAVNIARFFGVSDLIIGLTIVATGTSLPELASSIAAVRKGEHDVALGNILGSNLFNTLAVVGIAGIIHPVTVGSELFFRDILMMSMLTVSLFIMCIGFGGTGKINRVYGALLLACYISYTAYLGLCIINESSLNHFNF